MVSSRVQCVAFEAVRCNTRKWVTTRCCLNKNVIVTKRIHHVTRIPSAPDTKKAGLAGQPSTKRDCFLTLSVLIARGTKSDPVLGVPLQ
jgi:hypothetical protein